MSLPQDSSSRLAVGRRVLGALAPLVPGPTRFRWLGLPAGQIKGDPTGQVEGYEIEPAPVGALHHLPGGIAWGRGAHLDERFRLIHALSPGISRGMDFWMLKRQRFFPKVVGLQDETISLIVDGHGNYYHWMLDVLPRLATLEQDHLPRYHFLVTQELPFHHQTLNLLHIPASGRTSAAPLGFYSAPDLLVPTAPTGVSPENVRYIRHLLLERSGAAKTAPAHDRVFISRRHAHSRRILNEDDLDSVLRKYGFRTCFLEQLTLEQQMILFHGADVILAPHGAAWTNMIFSRPGTLALEIVPEGLEKTHLDAYQLYERLAEAAGVRYDRITAETSRADYPHAGDLRLDPGVLDRALHRLR